MDCLFCAIIDGKIPSKKVYEDELCYAFLDIAPQANEHIIIVPRRHIASLARAADADQALLGHLMLACAKIAKLRGIDASGYRVVTNIGPHSGQTVDHLHLHLLGGEALGGFGA